MAYSCKILAEMIITFILIIIGITRWGFGDVIFLAFMHSVVWLFVLSFKLVEQQE